MEEVETDQKDRESFPTDDGIDSVSNGTEYGDSAASPSSAISRNSEKACNPDDGHELPNANTSPVTEVKMNDDGLQDSNSSDLISGSHILTIPKPKKTQKRTLNELHEQLLKKHNPDLITSPSTSLSEIFKSSSDNVETDCQKEHGKEEATDLHSGDTKIPGGRETSNGLVKSLGNGQESQPVEKGLYRCSVVDCRWSFNRVNDLKVHMSTEHVGLKSYPCSFCFEEFEAVDLMTEHLKAHIKNVFKCSHCQISSDTKDELLTHLSTEHTGLPKKITIYVKILNNDRQKRAALTAKAPRSNDLKQSTSSLSSNEEKEPTAADKTDDLVLSGKPSTVAGDAGSSDKSSIAEIARARSSRKSSKPLKWQKDPKDDDVIGISSAEKITTVACDRCSFTCDSPLHLRNHQQGHHVDRRNVSGYLKCKICRFSTDEKLSFQNHMVHHKGRHVIRYYICPYCGIDTNSMDVVEEHVSERHPCEAFRFEVLQETVDFLQDLLECPICRGTFLWKEEFVSHLRLFHCLDELAEYLVDNFSGAFPPNGVVPRSLFRNLLPETADLKESPVEQMVVSSDEEESSEVTAVDQGQGLSEETSICVQQSAIKDKEKVFQFNCHTCNYASCDYDDYMAHFKTHSVDKSESLIKKLLTKPIVPPYSSDQSGDLELDLGYSQASSLDSPAAMNHQKTGGVFHCHLCPFTCSRSVHFRRHLAIHTRNETLKEGYRCGYCQFAHYRLNCVKFHLGKYHGNFPNKMVRIMDGIEIELGAEGDPGKEGKSPLSLPSTSTPLLRTAREKRPTVRYDGLQTSRIQNPPQKRSSASASCTTSSSSFSSSGVGISSQEMSLAELELQLPASMIYPEPVKCPMCDFTNRVRINLIRHMKLHREEVEMIGELPFSNLSSNSPKESSEGKFLRRDDTTRPLTLNTKDGEAQCSTSKRNLILDEKPLLRSILCEKTVAPQLEKEDVESDNSNSEGSRSEDRELGTMSRSNASSDYLRFSVRLQSSNQYKCKECSYTHRHPSKVKRHFNSKHVRRFPYRCGHCGFEAAETGKVRRHCLQVHPTQPVHVVRSGATAVERDHDVIVKTSPEIDDDVMIVDEMISGDTSDGHDQWLAQFVIKVDSNLQCCKLCGFQQEGAMSLHHHVYTKHLKLYPFSCKYCGVALTDVDRVKRHVEKHHAGMPLVVVRRHFESSAAALNGDFQSTSENEKIANTISVKNEPLEIDEEEAPQLDFYPKSDEFGSFPNSESWNDEGNNDSNDDESGRMPSCFPESSVNDRDDAEEADDFESFGAGSTRHLFKCVYCGIISKWNRRDIRLHIMHVHLKRRVYTCRHCGFGNSKSKAVVKSHCARFHPNKPVSVRDDVALFNAIVPIEDKNGVLTMAFSVSNGVPLLGIDELENYESKKLTSKSEVQKSPKHQIKTEVCELEASSGEKNNKRHFASIRGTKKNEIPLDLSSSRRLHSSAGVVAASKSEPVVRQRSEWHCKLCSFVNQNASHVKFHLVCYHLKLKPFSCPYCHLYIWKSPGVIKHIEKEHPGKEKKIHATVEEKAEYISANMERVVQGTSAAKAKCPVGQQQQQTVQANSTNTVSLLSHQQQKIGYFRCSICGYQDARNDKTKYHVIKKHLKLRQFSCPHCHLYMWGRQLVAKHIEEEHPGMEVSITRTFQEYEDFLKQIITRVASSGRRASNESSSSAEGEEEAADTHPNHDSSDSFQPTPESSPPPPPPASSSFVNLRCSHCSFVTDSESSLSAHKQSHRLFQCFHCEFRHTLAAKVQIHCLAKHPNKLVKYKQCDTSAASVHPSGNRPSPNISHPLQSTSCRNERPMDESSRGTKLFHPCDECPAHFDTAYDLEQHVSLKHGDGMYVCNYCHIVMWSQANIAKHLEEIHPEKRPSFKLVKKEPNDSRKRKNSSDDEEFSGSEDLNLDESSDNFHLANNKSTLTSNQAQCRAGELLGMYRCRLCNYSSGKVTVIRHHTMSHLRYHPYLCPYCDVARSVKSFPITKHVRSKHPDRELKFTYARDEALETQVKNSYYRVHHSKGDASKAEKDCNDREDVVSRALPPVAFLSTSAMHSRRKVLYKCTFCGLKTHMRTDMKLHLMREIQYKPFRCKRCPYTEPCKWSMRKHFRLRHGGAEVEVEEVRDSDNDARVEKLLEKCTVILKNSTDLELLSWRPSPTPQRRVYGAPPPPGAQSKPKAASLSSLSSALHPKQTFGASVFKRPFRSSKSMAIKFHRCPHCAYTNTSLKLVRGHMVKHGPFRLQCGYCDYRGHYPSRIHKHMRRHHPGMPFRCTKVSLPPKDQKTEEIPVIHVPQGALKPQAKPAPGTVFLDGVPVDIPLIPDSSGWYRCLQCDYQSVNREHYKMHSVIHRPPKWKCFYCDQKYPVIFRLRRHSNSKHPNLPIKWVEVETGKIVASLKPNSVGGPFAQNHQKSRSTARKSTSRGSLLSARPSESHMKSLRDGRRESATLSSSDSDLTIVDETPFVIGEPYSLVGSDSNSEAGDLSIATESGGAVSLCCHLCPYVTVDREDFVRHLVDCHANLDDSVTIEILPGVEDYDTFALRRCGFCLYETYAGQEFSAHVRTHTADAPVQCSYCAFASFSRKSVKDHVESEHPGQEVRLCLLKEQYTMSNDVLTRQRQSVNGLDAVVMLEDLMKLSEMEFHCVVTANGVSFQREPFTV